MWIHVRMRALYGEVLQAGALLQGLSKLLACKHWVVAIQVKVLKAMHGTEHLCKACRHVVNNALANLVAPKSISAAESKHGKLLRQLLQYASEGVAVADWPVLLSLTHLCHARNAPATFLNGTSFVYTTTSPSSSA